MSDAERRAAVVACHGEVLAAWNAYDAARYARCFANDGSIVGFDGSQVNGRAEIEAHLSAIFAEHRPPHYVRIVREVRQLDARTALLLAVVAMAPPGADDIIEDVNAVQSMVAVQDVNGDWRIALLHNTPAALHGRPHDAARLSAELRAQLPLR